MKPFPEQKISPAINDAFERVASAKSELLSVVAVAQSQCEHRFVSEMPFRTSEYLGSTPAHRICNHCRLVEVGSHWSGGKVWSRHDHGKSELGNIEGRIVQDIDREEFHAMRVI